jgi:CheY-like chemotaxis protein
LRRGNQHRSKGPASSCKTLLWIDDYAPGLEVYKAVFKTFGYKVLTACDGELGLRLLQVHTPDAVIVDYEMPGMDGAMVAAHVRRKSPKLPVVMFSGCSSVPARVKNAVTAFCEKTGSLNHLRLAIDNAVAATV